MSCNPVACRTATTAPAPDVTPSACSLCPGVPAAACACVAPLHYDGDNCVRRDQCPCVYGFITYVPRPIKLRVRF